MADFCTAVLNQADFKAILVYDVSRWGRFQDADEGCPYRKSNPDVVMMEPSEQWDRLDAAHRLRSATDRSILAEREVWPDLIVIQRSSFNMAHARRL